MKILITGGAGFIGSHVLYLLKEQESFDLVVVDNLSNGTKEFIPNDVHFFEYDLENTKKTNELFEKFKPDAVMHFAANIEAGESVKNPIKYFKNNIGGSLNLFDTMIKNNCKKLIFSSTAAVYGEPKYTPIDENHPLNPINPYGKSKLIVEEILKNLDELNGMKFISFRYFNAGGNLENGEIGENHNPETHLIPILLQAAKGKRETFKLFGNDYPTPDGTCIRDYIHVLDLAKAHILGLKYLAENEKSEIFNLGSEKGFSCLEVYKAACEVTGKDIPMEIGERREGDPSVLLASSERAKKILEWSPKYSDLENIVQSAWKWHNKS